MILEFVSVVDQTKFVPDVVNVDDPQLFSTVTNGALGIAVGLATPEPFIPVSYTHLTLPTN